ncbi:uncharacterized protein AMSG_10933 [Thecamonas trahens ATCC 50062]|uniref:Uncharacterized protein n=1 Tax=Thecamonas trahens ATCC 50062 TaxID=461836 RepID=A0A0L0DSU5_THETB|nr:hypothetical protein AMSG_10933 [Thecamonas trahens ATCC 50062]KNC55292.1 hypothetical protein AMSG_10933 [Thecamonas trahens ATCC 50062]|eukprot:XP_013753113.1 hypothetical protein AMSG_10933 [Thecamonas trahens ATCC 50062]
MRVVGCGGRQGAQFTAPFSRDLSYTPPQLMKGSDVTILQSLLLRSPHVSGLVASGEYGEATKNAVEAFQSGNKLSDDGIAGAETTNLLLDLHMYDGYKDSGTVLPGFKYKVYIPVFKNRSVEVSASLYDADNNLRFSFPVKTHGQNAADGTALNMLAGDGSTPTGLMTFDLNTPEEDVKDFGPYPVNRAVQGLAGNAAFLISDIRDGILMHTGDFDPSLPLPNSHGCVHSWPADIKQVWQILVNDLGVVVHNNTFGKLPYPYKPQGLLSIAIVD